MKAPKATPSKSSRPTTQQELPFTTGASEEARYVLPTASLVGSPTARRRASAGTTSYIKADATLQEVLNRLKTSKLTCVDVETSGLDWRKNHIVGYVCTFGPAPQDSYYVPFRHLGTANVGGRNGPTTLFNWDGKLAPGEGALISLLNRRDTTLFFHNGSFDLKFMHRASFRFLPRCEDTMVTAALINEWQGKFSLEFCANQAGVQAKKGAAMVEYLCSKFPEAAKEPKRAMGNFWRLPGDDPVGVDYAVGDGTTTWQLRDWQMKEIEKQELGLVWDVESRLIPVLARMSTRGIKIDEGRFEWLRATVRKKIEDLETGFGREFNARAKDDVRWWMEKHGHTDWPNTVASKRFPDGQASFTQGWLENYEAGRQVIQLRKLMTLRDTFMLPLQTEHLWNGRVHTNYNQLRNDEYGTITGRLSCDNPNLQAVPKHDEEIGRLFRSIFVPDDGMTWASVDMSQAEPRLLAYYSRCKVLMNGYRADPPLDAHTAVAIACNKNWDALSKDEKKHYRNNVAKRVNQTIITGGGKGVLVSKYKVPAEDVDRIWADYFRAMPEIRVIQKKMAQRMRQRGYLLTLLKRRCRLLNPDLDWQALNRALQGGNSDCLKTKIVEMDEYLESVGRPLDLLNNCHDAIDFQFSEDNRKHYDKCLEIMQDFSSEKAVIKLDVPMPVDAGEGKSWAEATYGEEK